MSNYVDPDRFIALILESKKTRNLSPDLYKVIMCIVVGICKLSSYRGLDWEDVAQDTMMEVYRRIDIIDIGLNPFAYVTQIAKTMAARELRRRRADYNLKRKYLEHLGKSVSLADSRDASPSY